MLKKIVGFTLLLTGAAVALGGHWLCTTRTTYYACQTLLDGSVGYCVSESESCKMQSPIFLPE